MGRGRLVFGLAWRNVRHRPWQAVLLLLALSLSATTITLALALTESGDRAWHRVARATNGFHVYERVEVPEDASPAQRERVRAEAARLGAEPGVIATGGPWHTAFISGEIDGAPIELKVQTRDASPAAVNQPLVTEGAWLDRREGAVLEDGFADAAGLGPGDTLTIAGQDVPVRGAALTVSSQPYPGEQPTTVWISPATATRLDVASDADEYEEYLVELRLADPDQAPAFAAAHSIEPDFTWQDRKGESGSDFRELATSLAGMAAFVVALALATAAILVAGRMAAQVRQVGTLKAVGVTPGQVTGVLLVEYLAVAVLATAIGLAAGTLLTPPVARLTRSLSVYGALSPSISASRAAIVLAVVAAVVLLATVRPALRGVRRSTVHSLSSNTRPPHRAGRLIRAIARLPLPLPIGMGLRAATRRPGRFVATTFGLTIGIALVIAGLALRTGVEEFREHGPRISAVEAADRAAAGLVDNADPIALAADVENMERISSLGFTIAAFLVGLAMINAVIAAVFSANDSARNHAILRTLGATPRQTVTAFVIAHIAACLLACALGIPLGTALYTAIRGETLGPIGLTPLTYVTTALIALLLYSAIAFAPARLLTSRPITPQLAYE
jgi:putative ABC transport system permease protein